MLGVMAQLFSLATQPIIAFIPTRNPELAKAFYRDRLGLRLVSEELPFALVFDAHGTMLRITVVKELSPAPFTVLGWRVADIPTAAKALRQAGVDFQRYPGIEQDELGIWKSPGGTKVAWFQDADGNTLSISEH